MKPTPFFLVTFLAVVVFTSGQAQSTTGGKSGGSTASTGSGYLTGGKRKAASNPQSMTIADEGASRDYMYVPPKQTKNRSASPDGSSNRKESSANATSAGSSPQKSTRSGKRASAKSNP
ncbi:hypothetical protein [Spirosoma fluminis]